MLRLTLRLQILFLIFTIIPIVTHSSDQPRTSADLIALAETEINQGNFQKAADLCSKAAQAADDSGDRKITARALLMSVYPVEMLGKTKEAETAQAQAEKICRELRDDSCLGGALNSLAYLNLRFGAYENGIKTVDQAIGLHEKSSNQKELANAYLIRGALLTRIGEFSQALEDFERGLQLAEKISDSPTTVAALRNIGAVYWVHGEYSLALKTYERGLQLAAAGNLELERNLILGRRGLVYWNQGDLGTALKDFNEAQSFFVKASSKPVMATNLLNIGILYMNLGDYGKSMESLQKSLNLSVEVKDRGLEATATSELGRIYWVLNQEDRALEHFQKAFRISEEIGEKRPAAYALTDIGGIYEQRENYQEAIVSYEKAQKLYEEMGEKRGIAQSIGNIAAVQTKQGKYELALANQRKTLAMMEAIGYGLDTGLSRMYIGTTLAKMGRNAEALEELSTSIETFRKAELTDNLSDALYHKAKVHEEMGQFEQSIALMKESIELTDEMRSDVILAEQKSGFLENKFQVFEDVILLLVQTGKAGEAFEYAQRSKARAFLDLLAEASIEKTSRDPALEERKKKLIRESTEANQKLREELENEKADPAKIAKWRSQVQSLNEKYAALLVEIRNLDPRFADLQRPKILTSKEAAKLLDARSILLEYFAGEKNSVVFVLTSTDLAAYLLPDHQKLTKEVEHLRALLQKPDPALEISEQAHTEYVQNARNLYRSLLFPAQAMMEGKEKIILAPDGALHYLPFESLIAKSKSTGEIDFSKLAYVGIEYEIEYVPSISVLGALRGILTRNHSSGNRLLAFADPALSKGTVAGSAAAVREWAGTLAPLPYSRTEVEEISKMYGSNSTSLYIGSEATEKNVKSLKLDQYRYIHFASHGLIDEENPQYSALVLAAESKSGEDGYLTMREVFDLRFNADLVVLSACKTGLGKKIRGEGVNGLSRAFLSAGTSEVLVSLWNVYDASTSEFMVSFYRNLEKKKMAHAAALKQARIEMIRSGKYSHPYYWAPFVLIGDQVRNSGN